MRRLRSVSSAPVQTAALCSPPVCQRRPLKDVAGRHPGRNSTLPCCSRRRVKLTKSLNQAFGLAPNVLHYFPCSTCRASTCMHGRPFIFLFFYSVFGPVPRGQPLPTRPIIHRVNKNGFGWNRRPVSCLKPTGSIVHSTDSLTYILLFIQVMLSLLVTLTCRSVNTHFNPWTLDWKLDLACKQRGISSLTN